MKTHSVSKNVSAMLIALALSVSAHDDPFEYLFGADVDRRKAECLLHPR
jgi:hypothetical protein